VPNVLTADVLPSRTRLGFSTALERLIVDIGVAA
jgi:hypothetical protein